MLGIGFAMLIIDLPVSNPLLFLLRRFYVGITTWYRLVLDTITGENFLMCPSLDAFNAMGNLVGLPPLMINETTLTLEHVMERLDAMEKKMLTEDHMGIIDKKIHNFATNMRSKAGYILKLLREKGTTIHERIEESPSRIDKLEEIFSNLSTSFASAKTIEKTPFKIGRASKNKGATSSYNNKEDLKMIGIHPDFVDVIRDPFCKNEIFGFIPRSVVIEDLNAKSLKDSKFFIEELDKDDKT